MPGRKHKSEFQESKYANDLVRIMVKGKGPFTRSMLAEELGKLYPKLYHQDLMSEVSSAIQLDKWSKANRFCRVQNGWYGLQKK